MYRTSLMDHILYICYHVQSCGVPEGKYCSQPLLKVVRKASECCLNAHELYLVST